MITSSSLSYALDEVVSILANESFFGEQFYMPLLYNVRTSGKRRERTASLGGLTLWGTKTSTQAADEDATPQEFEKDFSHTAYAKQVPIARELIDDQEFGLLEDIGQQLGATAAMTMESKAAEVFNNAFTSALSEDGLTLCNSAHLNAAGGNSQSNTGTAALTMANIKTTRTNMRGYTNYRGDKLNVMPDELAVPNALEEDAWEIVRSSGRPDTTNRADNFYNGMFNLYVWPWLTDANNWFMMASQLRKQNLLWFQRIALEIYGEGNLTAGTRKVGGYMRFSNGARDWRFIFGQNVA